MFPTRHKVVDNGGSPKHLVLLFNKNTSYGSNLVNTWLQAMFYHLTKVWYIWSVNFNLGQEKFIRRVNLLESTLDI